MKMGDCDFPRDNRLLAAGHAWAEVLGWIHGVGSYLRRRTGHACSTRSRGDKVKAIEIHHFVPRSHEVTRERPLRVVAGVDFRDGSQLSVRTEDEVDGRSRPLDRARSAAAPLVD